MNVSHRCEKSVAPRFNQGYTRVVKVNHHLVFSYGSNLYEPQLRERCPGARVLGAAELRGFSIAFVGESERWGGGVATVVRSTRDVVRGEVVALSDDDMQRLDRYEGVPDVYWREKRNVAMGMIRVRAWVYVRDGKPNAPGVEYLTRIALGYERLGFPIRELNCAC